MYCPESPVHLSAHAAPTCYEGTLGEPYFAEPGQHTTFGLDTKKVKSRRAAQSRRLHENSEFQMLAGVLPIARDITSQLDKATIVRITISYLKLRQFAAFGALIGPGKELSLSETRLLNIGAKILEAFDGFLLCLDSELKFVYVSETVSVGLGLSQIEMLGSDLDLYVHPNDAQKAYDYLRSLLYAGGAKRFCIRMKSNLAKRACRDMKDDSMGFKVVELCVGVLPGCVNNRAGSPKHGNRSACVAIALPLPAFYLQELKLDASSFVLTTTLDLTIYYCEQKSEQVLGHAESGTLRDMNMYSLVHPCDLFLFQRFHQEVLHLGASSSPYFRMQNAKTNAVLTVHSFGLKIQKNRNQAANQMLCFINYLVSNDNMLFSNFDESLPSQPCDEHGLGPVSSAAASYDWSSYPLFTSL